MPGAPPRTSYDDLRRRVSQARGKFTQWTGEQVRLPSHHVRCLVQFRFHQHTHHRLQNSLMDEELLPRLINDLAPVRAPCNFSWSSELCAAIAVRASTYSGKASPSTWTILKL